jgi:dihydroflavonol-4-reductase
MILLTGGTGFLGRYVLDELLGQGEQVRMLVRNPSKVPSRLGLEVVEGDILDVLSLEKAMDGVDKVVHAAAVVSFWKRRLAEMREINVQGTANVVDAALDAKVKQLVFVSSVAALGRPDVSVGPIDEQAKWVKSRYNTEYGRTKYLSELEVQRGVEEGLPAVICNPAIIVGAGDWEMGAPKLFTTVAKGLRFYNPGITGFVPAVDVARAIRVLLDSDVHNGERFVLVSDSLPYKEFFAWVAESVKAKAPSTAPPAFVVGLAARLSQFVAGITGKEPLITPQTARMSRGKFQYDGSKICKRFDFKYSDLRQIVKETGTQYLKEHAH